MEEVGMIHKCSGFNTARELTHIGEHMRVLLRLLILISCFFISQSAFATNTLKGIEVDSLPNGRVQIALQLSETASLPRSFSTESPPRLVIDLSDTNSGMETPKQKVSLGTVHSYDVVHAGNRTRVVFDLKEPITYKVNTSGDRIFFVLDGKPSVVTQTNEQRFAANKWVNINHKIDGIDFRRDEKGSGRVIVKLSDASMGVNVVERGKSIVVDFVDTTIPTRLKRKLDVTDFGTPIESIVTKANGGNVQMVVNAAGDYKHLAYQVNQKFIIDVSPESPDEIEGGDPEEVRYTGERLSLNFQDIAVRAVLQLLADFTGVNIVASDSVKGNITLRLNNVPWDEALAIILRTQGLAKRTVGNVIMIAPAEEVAAREKEELEAKKEVKELEPLTTELVTLNYAKAEEMATLLKDQTASLLTARGNVSIDERTNTLLIQDTPGSVTEARLLIQKLDIPVRQVLIEARIVNVDTDYEQNLGIRWGITRPTHLTGTLEGANDMQQNILNDNDPLLNVGVDSRLNVNLPAEVDTGITGSVGVALAKLKRKFLLDLEISALESEGVGELVSSPRLVTANQKEAYIEQGEEIPYQEATSSGATSVEFKKAVLALRVTPQITPDGKIIMDLKINQDRRSTQPEVLGVPAIDTQQIETQVLVDNGQTIVLGGVYQETKQHSVLRIPFLGSLPVVGNLFKSTEEMKERSELLIFITPKIVQQTART